MRENIIGEDQFDEAWYHRVLWACGLFEDLSTMKKGDQTPIGSKGVSLSGGQKNRLSLARALYARKPFLAIDDMLAGLDNATEKVVFDRVFGRNGLLRQTNATIVLATHATYYARYTDRVIFLSDGKIAEEGTYQELIERNVNFQALNSCATEEVPETELTNRIDESSKIPEKLASPQLQTIVEEDDEEDANRRAGDRRSLMFFLKAVGPLHVCLYWGLLTLVTVVTQIQCKCERGESLAGFHTKPSFSILVLSVKKI